MHSPKAGIEISKGRIRRTPNGYIIEDTRKYFVVTVDGVTAGSKADSEQEVIDKLKRYLKEAA